MGGVFAALAVVIMTLGGMIPVATYVIPVLCAILLNVILHTCGKRFAWAWYGAVAILGLLLGPDKEAAAVFLVIGYYPILKPLIDKMRAKWFVKGLFFNVAILAMYQVLIRFMGLNALSSEFDGIGTIGIVLIKLRPACNTECSAAAANNFWTLIIEAKIIPAIPAIRPPSKTTIIVSSVVSPIAPPTNEGYRKSCSRIPLMRA